MANIRITDKPRIENTKEVALLATDVSDPNLHDYHVVNSDLVRILQDHVAFTVTCSTDGATARKFVSIPGYNYINSEGKAGIQGVVLYITFTQDNLTPAPTLSIDNGPEFPIKVQGENAADVVLRKNLTYILMFAKDAWHVVNQSYFATKDFSNKPLAAREEAPKDKQVAVWNDTEKRFDTTKDIALDNVTSTTGTINTLTADNATVNQNLDVKGNITQNGKRNAVMTDSPTDGAVGVWSDSDQQFNTSKDLNLNVVNAATSVTTKDLTATGNTNLKGTTINGATSITGKTSVNGATTIKGKTDVTGDLSVTGNIYQKGGESYATHLEDLLIKDNDFRLRNEASTGLGEGEYSGMVVENYDGTKQNLNLVVDNKGVARLGKDAKLEPLLTRGEEDVMNPNNVLYWDDKTKSAKTIAVPQNGKGKVLVYKDEANPPTFEKYTATASWTGTLSGFEEAIKETNPDSPNFIEENSIINILDDDIRTDNLSNAIREGDMNAISSDAVFRTLKNATFSTENIQLEGGENIDELDFGTYGTKDFNTYSQLKGKLPFSEPFKLFCFKGGVNQPNSKQQLAIGWTSEKMAIRHTQDGGTWTGWTQLATLDSNGYVSKALLAKGLEPNAEMGGKKVATFDQLGYTGTSVRAESIGWYRLCKFSRNNMGNNIICQIGNMFNNSRAMAASFSISYGTDKVQINQLAQAKGRETVFSKIRLGYGGGDKGAVIDVYYNTSESNTIYANFTSSEKPVEAKVEKVIPEMETGYTFKEVDILDSCMAVDGKQVATTDNVFTADGSIIYAVDLSESLDFNDCPVGTSYSSFGQYESFKNAPSYADSYTIWTFKTNTPTDPYIRQIAYGRNSGYIFTRISTGKWTGWTQLATTETAIPFFPDTPEMRVNNDLFALPAGTYFWNESVPKNAPKMLPNGRINKIKRGSSGMISIAYTDNNEMYFTYDRQPWKQVATVGAKTLQTYNAGITKEV